MFRIIGLRELPDVRQLSETQAISRFDLATVDFEIGVGIAIARDPLLGPGRALVSASGSYLR